jgi:RND family efflux transporter MFP subunit
MSPVLQLTQEKFVEPTQEEAVAKRKSSGFARLLGVSGVAMALALPVGIYPRIMQNQELEQTHQKLVQQLPTVSITHPLSASPFRSITLPGTIEAVLETPVFARTNGYVKERFADIGDHVLAGQILADIQTPEVDESVNEAKAQYLTSVATKAQTEANRDRAIADLDTAIAGLAQAKANLVERESSERFALSSDARWRVLVQQGAVSAQDGDEKSTGYQTSKAAREAAEEQVRSAESQVTAARARLKAERANIEVSNANIDAARAKEHRTTTERGFNKVTAPFAGIITERNIDPGTLVSSGSDTSKSPMYRLARIDTVKVFVDVPQYASSGVRVGQSIAMTVKEFPGKVFTGKVARTSVALDSTARTLRTEIHVANNDLRLAPGMYVDVNFSVPRPSKTFLIPANALVTRTDGPQVVLVSDKAILYRNVQIGADLGKQIEVVAGLTGKESMVVNPADTLRNGTLVSTE